MSELVGPVLRMSDDIDGIVAAIRDDNPDREVTVTDRGAYVRIEAPPATSDGTSSCAGWRR